MSLITVLVFTDGRRSCFKRTIESFRQRAAAAGSAIGPVIVIDDSADDDYMTWLGAAIPEDWELVHHLERRGFAGAIQSGWDEALRFDTPYIFHLEDDFTFNKDIPLFRMASILNQHPEIVQLALKRQPWNETERKAGDLIAVAPKSYLDRGEGVEAYLEHRLFFTTNPSLYRRSLAESGWPQEEFSEGVMTHRLINDPDVCFAYLGKRNDPPWVTHIGVERAGSGY